MVVWIDRAEPACGVHDLRRLFQDLLTDGFDSAGQKAVSYRSGRQAGTAVFDHRPSSGQIPQTPRTFGDPLLNPLHGQPKWDPRRRESPPAGDSLPGSAIPSGKAPTVPPANLPARRQTPYRRRAVPPVTIAGQTAGMRKMTTKHRSLLVPDRPHRQWKNAHRSGTGRAAECRNHLAGFHVHLPGHGHRHRKTHSAELARVPIT